MSSRDAVPAGFLREARGVATMLRLLVLVVATLLGVNSDIASPRAYWTVTCVYALSVLGPLLMLRNSRFSDRWGTVIFLFDIIAISSIIVMRGHDTQGLLVATFALMLLAATLEGLGNTFANVLLVGGAFIALTQWGLPGSQLLSAANLAQLAFFVVTGILMGYAADRARSQAQARRHAERHRRRAQVELFKTSRSLQRSEEMLEKAQESLRANERLYTLGMFAAGVNHELGNPVAVVLASVDAADEIVAELVPSSDSDGRWDELREAHAVCRDACRQLRALIDELGRMTRAGRCGEGRAVVAEQIDVAVRLLRKVAGPDLRVIGHPGSTCEVSIDPGRLLQVLLNLGKNAIDAIGDKPGTVRFFCHDEAGDSVRLEVIDDGPGIPEEIRDHIFDAFATTKGAGKGTGLGLHLVKEIVTSQRGTLKFHSELGRGTRFVVRLPTLVEEGETNHATESPDHSRRGRRAGDPPRARIDAAAGTV